MTYTFKLSRRLAVSRESAVLAAWVMVAACAGDSTGPDTNVNSFGSPALQVTPRKVTIETNQPVLFRGHIVGLESGAVLTPIAWVSSGGLIRSDGTFSSTSSGTFKVVGRGRGWKQVDTATVTVVPPADLVRLQIAPDTATLAVGESRPYTATGYLQDGSATSVGVTWSSKGGTLDPSGLFTAGDSAGRWRVIATNASSGLADTAFVRIESPPVPAAPTLVSVVLAPGSASLTTGGSKTFAAYGRNSVGDSVAVPVTFQATGGTISSTGLYTAGTVGGNFRVIASASGLADTAPVALTAPSQPGTTVSGLPFGTYGGWDGARLLTSPTDFSLSSQSLTASVIIDRINAARSNKVKLVLAMTGGKHENYLTDGVFDRSKWDARMATYNTAAIKTAVAQGVADGTIVGANVMDEPHVSGMGDGNTWGPAGTMTKVRVDSLCQAVKTLFPTLPVGVAHQHDKFEPQNSYRVCEFLIDQYSSRLGDVTTWRDAGLALGRRDHMAILFSMNIINGGVQDKDGVWDCSGTGGLGELAPNCSMSPQQLRSYGAVLGPAGCGLLMWRYDVEYMARLENLQAFRDVKALLAGQPARTCGR